MSLLWKNTHGAAIQLQVFLGELADFNVLVRVHVMKNLARVTGGPPNFQGIDPGGLTKPDVLAQRGRAEGSA